ncbi:MAG: CYTH domain-containing protein [Lachnospiraceae bacterium]
MEIERKFKVSALPTLDSCIYQLLEQGYLSTDPVVRVRREDSRFYLTYKGQGLLAREEYNLPLTEEAYRHLLQKADGIIIRKRRYLLPYRNHTIELDIFEKPYEGLVIAEVEFPTEEEAISFQPPSWFGEEVTYDSRYHNSALSQGLSP